MKIASKGTQKQLFDMEKNVLDFFSSNEIQVCTLRFFNFIFPIKIKFVVIGG